MVNRFERFSFAISEISRCWHRIAAEEMGKYNLKGPYAVYFTTLSHHTEGIPAVQLAELCGRDKADVSRAVTTLEKAGFLIRDSKNSYRACLRLTDQGLALAADINRKAQIAVERASAGLDPKKRSIFYEALELITGNLQQLSKNGLTDPEEKEL